MKEIDALLNSLFDGRSHQLAKSMAGWLSFSRRFCIFVADNLTKIRKKVRTTPDAESLHDLELELETAYLLLCERSLSVGYETRPRHHGRSPDFAVTFTSSLEFMVEVTRLRPAEMKTADSNHDTLHPSPSSKTSSGDRFSDMLGSKLGQFLPQRVNLLIVGVEASILDQLDLKAFMLRLQQRAEADDSNLIRKNGFRDRGEFFNHYRRLSAVLVRGIPLQPNLLLTIWENPQAKIPLPGKVRTALSRSHSLKSSPDDPL